MIISQKKKKNNLKMLSICDKKRRLRNSKEAPQRDKLAMKNLH